MLALVHVDFRVGFGEDCKHQMAHHDEILAESVTVIKSAKNILTSSAINTSNV
jgi:hypothetical protein